MKISKSLLLMFFILSLGVNSIKAMDNGDMAAADRAADAAAGVISRMQEAIEDKWRQLMCLDTLGVFGAVAAKHFSDDGVRMRILGPVIIAAKGLVTYLRELDRAASAADVASTVGWGVGILEPAIQAMQGPNPEGVSLAGDEEEANKAVEIAGRAIQDIEEAIERQLLKVATLLDGALNAIEAVAVCHFSDSGARDRFLISPIKNVGTLVTYLKKITAASRSAGTKGAATVEGAIANLINRRLEAAIAAMQGPNPGTGGASAPGDAPEGTSSLQR